MTNDPKIEAENSTNRADADARSTFYKCDLQDVPTMNSEEEELLEADAVMPHSFRVLSVLIVTKGVTSAYS